MLSEPITSEVARVPIWLYTVYKKCTNFETVLLKDYIQSESKKNPPLVACGFLTFFHKRLRILNQFFTNLLHVPIYARLQIFIQLAPTLTKLCHVQRDCLVHIICSKCPVVAETHAFRRLWKSLIALLIVVCGKSSQIYCFYNVNNHIGYDMTSTVMSFAQ